MEFQSQETHNYIQKVRRTILEREVQAEEDLKKINLARKEKALKFRKVETAQITLNTDTTLKLINAENKLWSVED